MFQDGNAQAGARVLQPSAGEILGRLGFCAGFAGLSLLCVADARLTGLGFMLALAGLGGLLFYAFMFFVAAPSIRLDETGFSIIQFGRARRFAWAEIEQPFGLYATGMGKNMSIHVGFTVQGRRPMRPRRGADLAYTHRLPKLLGLGWEEKADLFNGYWSRARGLARPAARLPEDPRIVARLSRGKATVANVLVPLLFTGAALVVLIILLKFSPQPG